MNRIRVAIADDQPMIRSGFRLQVQHAPDLELVGAASTGEQAVALARAQRPDVLLMDEPCSALDPIATGRIEDLMQELKDDFTIVIVTHNMQQAARCSDTTAFFNIAGTGKPGRLIEVGDTSRMFSNPAERATEDYISGRFG